MVVKLNNFLKAGQKFQMLTQHSMSLTQVILEGRSFFFLWERVTIDSHIHVMYRCSFIQFALIKITYVWGKCYNEIVSSETFEVCWIYTYRGKVGASDYRGQDKSCVPGSRRSRTCLVEIKGPHYRRWWGLLTRTEREGSNLHRYLNSHFPVTQQCRYYHVFLSTIQIGLGQTR